MKCEYKKNNQSKSCIITKYHVINVSSNARAWASGKNENKWNKQIIEIARTLLMVDKKKNGFFLLIM